MPDVRFRLLNETGDGGPAQNPLAAFVRITRDETQAAWPGVGHFLLHGGREVLIKPALGVPDATLRAYLLGPVLSMLLFQRGFLVLHGSAAALCGAGEIWRAIGFLGHSGAGKSTMTAALHARGHRMVSDDVLAITPLPALTSAQDSARSEQPLPMIAPAFPQLRLWPQTLEALNEDPFALPLLYPLETRRARRLTQGFDAALLPLRALFVLESGDLAVERLAGAGALLKLVEHTYCVKLENTTEAAIQFQNCGVLAQTLPVFALRRPNDLGKLSDVAALIETAMAQL